MNAQLTGYAVNIDWLDADHTYVLSSDGFVWPCWGRSSGGRAICSGTGDSAVANCLSQTDSHAGILYGITGVCHQTANRILFPADVIVSEAHGYWASSAVYGTYGTSIPPSLLEWEARKARCRATQGLPGFLPPPSDPGGTPDSPSSPTDGTRGYLERVRAMYDLRLRGLSLMSLREDSQASFLGEELEIMIDFRLGGEASMGQLADLRGAQTELLSVKRKLETGLLSKGLSAQSYSTELNKQVLHFLEQGRKILDDAPYERLFGLKVNERVLMIDIEILARYH